MRNLLRLLSVAIIVACSMEVSAKGLPNVDEPEFIGDAFLVKGDDSVTKLEKQRVMLKTKANASMYIVGIGAVKTKITVSGGQSNVRTPNGTVRLIIKSVDNLSDPMSIISLFKFDAKSKVRKAEIAKSSTYGGVSEGTLKNIEFNAKKFGESSYYLEVDNMVAGEYGIIVTNPNNKDEKNVIVSCFGVD